MNDVPWPITFISVTFSIVYLKVLVSTYSRLRNVHPELWATLVWRPANKVAQNFLRGVFEVLCWGMDLNAIVKFANRKAYNETGDDTLIKLGSTLHIMNRGWVIIIIGGLIFQWIFNK